MRGAPALARRHRQAAVHAAAERLRIALDPASADVGTGQRAAREGRARRAFARRQIQIGQTELSSKFLANTVPWPLQRAVSAASPRLAEPRKTPCIH